MEEGGAQYTVDVVYPSAFGVFQSPVHLSYAAWLGGRAGPRPDRPFTYCDLGTGAGLTLCVLADCYPDAEFHGVDLNPEHIRLGRDLAARAGLKNVTFHEASFADLGGLKLPPLAYVGLSGVYSWLSKPLREACMAFAGERLTDDGLVFLHYGALPGNSQIDALYALLKQAAEGVEGDSLTRYRHATGLLEKLRQAKARFFQVNPYAEAWFRQLEKEDPRSMAHEVLNAQRASLSLRDALGEAAPHGLTFVSNAQLELNDLQLVAPDALREDLSRCSRVTREMMLDTVRNAHSRMDVLGRTGFGAGAGAPELWLDRLSRGPLADQRRTLKARTGVDFEAAIYGDILQKLDGRSAALPSLLGDPTLARHGSLLADAVQRLVAVKLLNVLVRPYEAPASEGGLRMPSRLNRLILEEQIEAAGQLPFASPVAGTQVLLPPADRFALLALLGVDTTAAWTRIERSGRKITHTGKPVGSAADFAAAAAERARDIRASAAPALTRLGILAPWSQVRPGPC